MSDTRFYHRMPLTLLLPLICSGYIRHVIFLPTLPGYSLDLIRLGAVHNMQVLRYIPNTVTTIPILA